MADVNANQGLRFKEIMKRVIPGGYLFTFVYLSETWFGNEQESESFVKIMNLGSDLSEGAKYAMLAIVVYVVGVLINYLASLCERLLYKSRLLKRPSQKILNDDTEEYKVNGIERIREEFNDLLFKGVVCQEQAHRIVNIIKGRINRKDNMVEEMYHQSILARNLLGAQIISVLVGLFLNYKVFTMPYIFLCTILSLLFYWEWRRKNFVYMRNIFQEDLKTK